MSHFPIGSSKETIMKMKKKRLSSSSSSTGNKIKGSMMKLSTDPQSVAARERRHRISERFKILQSLVPGGSKMDTVSMLEEAIDYVKFLKTQIWLHQNMITINNHHQIHHLDLDDHDLDLDRTVFLAQPDHQASVLQPQVAMPSLLLPDYHHQYCYYDDNINSSFQAHETTSFESSAFVKY